MRLDLISTYTISNQDFDTIEDLGYGGVENIDRMHRINAESNPSKHLIDIKEQDLVQLNIDLEQRGLGGDDSWWSKPQKEYQIKGGKQEYGFYLIPFVGKTREDFVLLSKRY